MKSVTPTDAGVPAGYQPPDCPPKSCPGGRRETAAAREDRQPGLFDDHIPRGTLLRGLPSRHRSRNLRRLSRIRRRLVFLPFDERAAIEYGRIREETHSRGTPIPVADTMIAAIARPLRLRVLSHDEHFRWVPGLHVEDWLA